jgi:hypothetical protein
MQQAIAGIDQINRAWMGDYRVEGFGALGDDSALSSLGTAFYKLNDDALGARYGEEPSGESFKFNPMAMNGWGSTQSARCKELKALHCLRYQCSEGKVPETALYRGLEKAIGDLAGVIIDEWPEYKSAKWG